MNIPKITTAIGIFITGFTTGYLAFRSADPLKKQVGKLTIPKCRVPKIRVLPEIPDLDDKARLTESELNFRFNE